MIACPYNLIHENKTTGSDDSFTWTKDNFNDRDFFNPKISRAYYTNYFRRFDSNYLFSEPYGSGFELLKLKTIVKTIILLPLACFWRVRCDAGEFEWHTVKKFDEYFWSEKFFICAGPFLWWLKNVKLASGNVTLIKKMARRSKNKTNAQR